MSVHQPSFPLSIFRKQLKAGRATQTGQNLGASRTGAASRSPHKRSGVLLRNRLYAGIVDDPEYGVRGKRGDFEPLISEALF